MIIGGLCTSGFTHHGTSQLYDLNKSIVLKGTITEFKFTNPHVLILFDATDETGKTANWTVEGSSVYFWSRGGFNRNSLKRGDVVTVTLSPARSGAAAGVMLKIVMPNGRELAWEGIG